MSQVHKHRPERVATQIKELLAETIAAEVKDPRVGFVTVTAVKVARDFSTATVMVSVMGEEKDKERALEGLESARGFLRTVLANSMHLRTIPELRFRLDRGLEHARRIDELLDQIKRPEDPS